MMMDPRQRHALVIDGAKQVGQHMREVLATSNATRASRTTPGVLAAALAPVMSRAEINPELAGADLQEALQRAIALHRYSCTWTKVPAGWVAALSFPEPRRFFGQTLEEALAWCLEWIMAEEMGHTRGDHEPSQRTVCRTGS